MNRIHTIAFSLLASCVGNVESLPPKQKVMPLPSTPKVERVSKPLQVPIVKTFGQIRETYEAITGVKVNATLFNSLKSHLPQGNALQNLTPSSQAAIVRLSSAHCAEVMKNQELTQKLFGLAPSVGVANDAGVETLLKHSVRIWPDPDPSATETLRVMLEGLTQETPRINQQQLILAACTAVLASAPITTH